MGGVVTQRKENYPSEVKLAVRVRGIGNSYNTHLKTILYYMGHMHGSAIRVRNVTPQTEVTKRHILA